MINWVAENDLRIRNETEEDRSRRDWTQLGTRERTVIDYVLRNEAGKEKIRGMDVGGNIKLDHLL